MSDALPDVEDLNQVPDPYPVAVAVKHDGPVLVHQLPSRLGTISSRPLTTAAQQVAWPDPKRRRLTLLCGEDWTVSHSGSGGTGGPWPANVPLTLESATPVFASSAGTDPVLTIVPEMWAD